MIGLCKDDSIFDILHAEDYIDEILADKPDYLTNDDFVDNLYKDMATSDEERKTISII